LSQHYVFVSMETLLDGWLAGRSPRKGIVLSFDDGYSNAYTLALPLLRRMGVPFSVFVTTGYVDTGRVLWNDLLEFAIFSTREKVLPAGVLERDLPLETPADRGRAVMALKPELKRLPLEEAAGKVRTICEKIQVDRDSPELELVRFLTSDQISDMAGQGVELGGHTVTHPILSRETRERVRSEVTDCKARLESMTGRHIRCFAYPNGQRGDFNEMVKQEVIQAGYEAAFTAIRGPNRPGLDLFEIKRLPVDCRWSYEEFDTRVSGLLEAMRG
ncbi:MAG: polysaccharide deacetylase family protein, partial [bacterium]